MTFAISHFLKERKRDRNREREKKIKKLELQQGPKKSVTPA